MKFVIFVLMFFILNGLLIISNNNFHLDEEDEIKEFGELYLVWIEGIYSNTIEITGNIIKSGWIA